MLLAGGRDGPPLFLYIQRLPQRRCLPAARLQFGKPTSRATSRTVALSRSSSGLTTAKSAAAFRPTLVGSTASSALVPLNNTNSSSGRGAEVDREADGDEEEEKEEGVGVLAGAAS